MKNKKFYLATAIAYTSAIPHIGNVYEIILADSIARFYRQLGYDVFFQTGTDEHGQKIMSAAAKNNLKPQEYVDYISNQIRETYDTLNISYDNFIRTTDLNHIKGVQKVYEHLLKNDDIYKGKYEGYYSLAEESYVSEDDLVDGKTKLGDEPIWMEEEVYFFRLSKYQKRLVKYINEHPDFITPESRKNEILSFLKEPLLDISITRSLFDWGVEIPFNKKHIAYVWIDALLNYLTGIGYGSDEQLFKKLWPTDLNVIGKDIIRFHAVFYPILLMALGLELPKQIFAHPWILIDKKKMSKSSGNTIYTHNLIKYFGVDATRYYCLHEIPYQVDGNLTYELMIERYNSDLANTIGNLLNRTIGMYNKYIPGYKFKKFTSTDEISTNLRDIAEGVLPKMSKLMQEHNVSSALEEVMVLAREANKYIDLAKPWELFKNKEDEKVVSVLAHLFETIRYISVLISPFLPSTAKEMQDQIGINNLKFDSLKKFGDGIPKPQEAKPMFLRINQDELMGQIINDESSKKS